jgi:hypothetical protein
MNGRLLDRNRKNNHTLCFADAGRFRGNDFDDDITIYLRNSGKLAVKKDAAISSQRAVLLLARLKISQSECPKMRVSKWFLDLRSSLKRQIRRPFFLQLLPSDFFYRLNVKAEQPRPASLGSGPEGPSQAVCYTPQS